VSQQIPPQLKLPSTSNRRMAIIAFVLIAALSLFPLLLNSPTSRPTSGRGGEIVADIVIPQKKSESPNLPSDSSFIELEQSGTTIKTGFPRGWSRRVDGRQIILTRGDEVCQSLVIPLAEYDAMVTENGGLVASQKGLIELTAPPGARVSADAAPLFDETGPPARTGVRVIATIRVGNRTTRIQRLVVWARNASYAAGLTCARLGTDTTPSRDLEAAIRGYTIK
jgi:hypothetical protein